jgi:hypothetical protein
MRREDLHSMDDAPEIRLENRAPASRVAEELAPPLDAGIVHQQADLAESGKGRILQPFDIAPPADIRRDGQNLVRAARSLDHHGGAALEHILVPIREAKPQTKAGKAFRGRQTDAAGSPGYDGNAPGCDRGMGYHGRIPVGGEQATGRDSVPASPAKTLLDRVPT